MNCTHCTGTAGQPIDVGEPHPQQPHDCTAMVSQLVDAAIRTGQAVTTAVLQCCAAPRGCGCGCGCGSTVATGSADASGSTAAVVHRAVRSKQFSTRANTRDRRIALETPLANGHLAIPHERITLHPSDGRDPQSKPLGALKPNQMTFHVEVEAGGLPGAVYFGTARVSALDGSSDELIPVFIEL